ncbi:MAG: hypothetical protein J6W04_04310 [Bacteroidales bacterium]|nr:hypothetical protein [Bacteroidales bacterium]
MKVGYFLDRLSMASTISKVVFYNRLQYNGEITGSRLKDRMYGVWTNRTVNSFMVNGKVLTIYLKPTEE